MRTVNPLAECRDGGFFDDELLDIRLDITSIGFAERCAGSNPDERFFVDVVGEPKEVTFDFLVRVVRIYFCVDFRCERVKRRQEANVGELLGFILLDMRLFVLSVDACEELIP